MKWKIISGIQAVVIILLACVLVYIISSPQPPPQEKPIVVKVVGGPEKIDSLEENERLKEFFIMVDEEVKKDPEFPQKTELGSVHIVWDIKKKILKEKYHIDWQSPAELNPLTMYD